jgi:hypothetical protein
MAVGNRCGKGQNIGVVYIDNLHIIPAMFFINITESARARFEKAGAGKSVNILPIFYRSSRRME